MFFKKTLGLDISDYSIEALELQKSWKKYKVHSYARKRIEPGLVEDGKILKLEELVKQVKELLAKASPQPIKTQEASLALPESKVFIKIFKAPFDRQQLPQHIPYDLEDLYITQQEQGDQIMVAAAPKEIVNDYVKLLTQSGLKPALLTLESLSTARAILTGEKETICLLDIGARTTLISIFDQGNLKYSYNFPVAGKKITEKLSQELNLDFATAEGMKIQEGLSSLEVKKAFQEIILEIKKAINYYQEKNNKKIKKIVLTGGSANLPGLAEYFKEVFGLSIIIGDPLKNINNNAILKEEKSRVLYANVAGLAMENQINLLP